MLFPQPAGSMASATGEPVAPMLVWSDLRGMEEYKRLRAAGFTGWPQVPSAKLPAAIAVSGRDPAGLPAGDPPVGKNLRVTHLMSDMVSE